MFAAKRFPLSAKFQKMLQTHIIAVAANQVSVSATLPHVQVSIASK
jgi:hypothetical protein